MPKQKVFSICLKFS